jgi:Flp pilus assembly protein TadG
MRRRILDVERRFAEKRRFLRQLRGGKVRRQPRWPAGILRDERSQALILFTLALPMVFSLVALVIDGSTLMVHKRAIQNAADSAALAVAQNIDISTGTCDATCSDYARQYARANGIDVDTTTPSWHRCNDADPAHPTDTNCYAYPYVNRADVAHPRFDEVEVRLREPVSTFFTGIMNTLLGGHALNVFNVSARSVAVTSPELNVTQPTTNTSLVTNNGFTDPGSTTPAQTNTNATTSTTFSTTTTFAGNIALFAKDTTCGSGTSAGIYVGGTGNNGKIIGLSIDNGSANLNGNNKTNLSYLDYGGPNHCALNDPSHVTTLATHTDDRDWPKTWDQDAICAMPGAHVFNGSGITNIPNGSTGIWCSLNGTLNVQGNGNFTVIAKTITIGSQTITVSAYFDNLLFYQLQGSMSFTANNSSITGWMWVPNGRLTFDGNSGAQGFYEAQQISITGNSFTITGTGPQGEPTTSTTTTPTTIFSTTTTPATTVLGTTIQGTTVTNVSTTPGSTSTIGTTIGLGE